MLPNNQLFNCALFKRRNRIRNAKTVLARVFTNLVKVWGYKSEVLVFIFLLKQNLQINFFSWINLTFCRSSATSSIAWLKPFSPPYETSTVRSTFALIFWNYFRVLLWYSWGTVLMTNVFCSFSMSDMQNRRHENVLKMYFVFSKEINTCNLWSNISDPLSSVLKSAEPARIRFAQATLSSLIKHWTAVSATLRT